MILGHLTKKFLFSPSQQINKNVIHVGISNKILGIILIILILMHTTLKRKLNFPS